MKKRKIPVALRIDEDLLAFVDDVVERAQFSTRTSFCEIALMSYALYQQERLEQERV